MARYVLTLQCPDGPGIVNRVTGALLDVGANISESAQFGDPDTDIFTMRVVFDTDEANTLVESATNDVTESLGGQSSLRPVDRPRRAIIMVSKEEHCLLDLLYRHRNGELDIEIPLVISNHRNCQPLAERYDVAFEQVPVTPDTKNEAESVLLRRVEELNVDFVVLARYMQVLSANVCNQLPMRIINIHHSFLPGFKGARPYHQAHERGVKLIGATAHYVTVDLDEGPIIAQDVERVDHKHSTQDLVRMGRDVERMVLSRAVRYQAEDRIIPIGQKTIVFS